MQTQELVAARTAGDPSGISLIGSSKWIEGTDQNLPPDNAVWNIENHFVYDGGIALSGSSTLVENIFFKRA